MARPFADLRGSTAERARDGAQLRSSTDPWRSPVNSPIADSEDYGHGARRPSAKLPTHATRNGSVGTSWIFDNGYVGIGGNRFERIRHSAVERPAAH